MRKILFSILLGAVSSLTLVGEEVSGEVYDYTKTMAPERPYMHEYDKTMTMKLFMARPDGMGGTVVGNTFADALDVIKGVDNLTRGVPKIIYLVGWQYEGHDCKYPSFSQFNEALKRPQDKSARDSYLWLQKEAKKYNTTVSVHVTLHDAEEDSPLFDEYVEKDLICKTAKGELSRYAVFNGVQCYHINVVNEWNSGMLQKRFDELTENCNLTDAKTFHCDAFLARLSPGHGHDKLAMETAMRKFVRYMRDKDIDVTVEFLHNGSDRIDQMYGLIPMVWWMDLTSDERAKLPASLIAGGRDGIFGGRIYDEPAFLFGDGYTLEDDFNFNDNYPDRDRHAAFERTKHGIATRTIPYMFYNRHKVLAYDRDAKTVDFEDGIKTDWHNRKVTQNGRLLRDGDDTFYPLAWKEREIMAYSKDGYKGKKWELPENWKGVKKVKAATITTGGLTNEQILPVKKGKVTLSLKPNEMISITAE